MSSVVEQEALPIRVDAEPRILVFVEVRSVERGQRRLVPDEVGRHPVQDDPDPGLMEAIDEPHELLWRSVAARRGEVARRLVSPGRVVRVLHHRQQLHVGVASASHVVDQPIGDHLVGRHLLGRARVSPPRADVQLVDRDRRLHRRRLGTLRHPCLVAPLIGEIPDDRPGARCLLGEHGHRIRLEDRGPVLTRHRELVDLPRACRADRARPHS